MRIFINLLAVFIPLVAVAETPDFRIDYEALFELHADRVVDSDRGDFQELEMPGEVIIDRRGGAGNYSYNSADLSEGGAVGCLMLIVSELEAYRRECPAIANEAQSARMENALERVVEFAAENTYPPAPLAEYRAAFETGIVSKQSRIDFSNTENCAENDQISSFIGHIYGDSSEALFDDALEVPRLPVLNPCL